MQGRCPPSCSAVGVAPYVLEHGAERIEFDRFEELSERVHEIGKKGPAAINRYKGLGEMNPEQLWETTMDPSRRTLLQVRVEDAYAADGLFSTLMGDLVEPRRAFIESNALNVRNLDVWRACRRAGSEPNPPLGGLAVAGDFEEHYFVALARRHAGPDAALRRECSERSTSASGAHGGHHRTSPAGSSG